MTHMENPILKNVSDNDLIVELIRRGYSVGGKSTIKNENVNTNIEPGVYYD